MQPKVISLFEDTLNQGPSRCTSEELTLSLEQLLNSLEQKRCNSIHKRMTALN